MTVSAATKSEIKSSIQRVTEIALISSRKLIVDEVTSAVEKRPSKRLRDITGKAVQVFVKERNKT